MDNGTGVSEKAPGRSFVDNDGLSDFSELTQTVRKPTILACYAVGIYDRARRLARVWSS